ncbi:MAG: hypothetical protein HY082_01845 [Gammaproteobacteria bacterium]|nr:hypothetical protein [Gammaproteobacteria bacterium]
MFPRPAAARLLLVWLALALPLHLAWEIAQLPLYTLWDDPDRGRVVSYVLHCVVGDVLIAGTTYLLTAIVFRDLAWPVRWPWTAGAFMLAAGLGFTVFSERVNVYVTGAWAYQPAMPLVAGIGLTPLLQWLIVPTAMILIVRRMGRNSHRRCG